MAYQCYSSCPYIQGHSYSYNHSQRLCNFLHFCMVHQHNRPCLHCNLKVQYSSLLLICYIKSKDVYKESINVNKYQNSQQIRSFIIHLQYFSVSNWLKSHGYFLITSKLWKTLRYRKVTSIVQNNRQEKGQQPKRSGNEVASFAL